MNPAVKLYRKFNRKEPTRVSIAELPLTETLIDLGRAVAVAYESAKEGRPRHYEHEFKKASTRIFSTCNGQMLIIAGEGLNVSDWIRGG